MQERRAQARVPVEMEGRFGELQAAVQIVNLSAGGCTIICAPHSRSVDENVRLTFQLPNGSKKWVFRLSSGSVKQRTDFLRHGEGVRLDAPERNALATRSHQGTEGHRRALDPVIPCRVASPQSPTPFHRALVA